MVSKNKPNYDEEFLRSAVDHLIRSGKSCKDVADGLGISQPTLRTCRKKYTANPEDPLRMAERERIEEPEREVRELREERDILKKSAAIFIKPRK